MAPCCLRDKELQKVKRNTKVHRNMGLSGYKYKKYRLVIGNNDNEPMIGTATMITNSTCKNKMNSTTLPYTPRPEC